MHPVVVKSELVIASASVKCVFQCLERLGCTDREVRRLKGCNYSFEGDRRGRGFALSAGQRHGGEF